MPPSRRSPASGSGGPPGPQGPKFIPCPRDRELTATATIGRAGGSIVVGDHRLELPPDALTRDVVFTATVLPSAILKVRIEADGRPTFAFDKPAQLTLGFATCGPPPEADRLRIYKIDPRNDAVLEEFRGSTVNLNERTVTTSVTGLSVYTLGVPP